MSGSQTELGAIKSQGDLNRYLEFEDVQTTVKYIGHELHIGRKLHLIIKTNCSKIINGFHGAVPFYKKIFFITILYTL